MSQLTDPFCPQEPRASDQIARAVAAGRLHHAWLLVGGEKDAARDFAAAVQAALLCTANRQKLTAPCGTCDSCRSRRKNMHPDGIVLAPNERGHISIEQVRKVTSRLALSHQAADRKVVWIWAADHLLPAAQHALLKGLEEPHPGTVFLLSAQRPGALLPTVRSRCLSLYLGAGQALAAMSQAAPSLQSETALAAPQSDCDSIRAALTQLAQPVADLHARWPDIMARSSEWGRDPAQTERACLAIEREVRDALAWHLGAPQTDCAQVLRPSLAQATECAELIAWARARNTLTQQRTWHLLRLLATLYGPPTAASWRDM